MEFIEIYELFHLYIINDKLMFVDFTTFNRYFVLNLCASDFFMLSVTP